jgi:hypothetical protein
MKKRIALFFLVAALASAQSFGFWSFNLFLYFEFASNPTGYAEFVADGSPCYAWVGGGEPDSAQPACFYDPTNTNSGAGE